MQNTISLNKFFESLKKHIKSIILFVFLGIMISAGVTFFLVTPKFSSQAQLVVTLPQTENTNVNDVNSNLQMINTYKDFIVSDLVLNQVEDRLKSDYKVKMTPQEIKNAISVTQNQNSQMFSIITKSTNANQAMYIANTVATIFQENAKDVLNVDRITIISKAVVNTTPVSPNDKLNLIIGILLGLIAGIAFALVADLLDRTVKDSKFIIQELEFTILGTVPEVSEKDIANYIKKAKKINQNNVAKAEGNISSEINEEENNEPTIRRRRSRI